MRLLRQAVLDVLRVPPPPSPPLGSSEGATPFRASPRFLRYRLVSWGIQQVFALVGIFFFLFVFRAEEYVGSSIASVLTFFEIVALVLFGFQALWSFSMIKLDWEQRWYLVTDSALRIREGVFRVREQTMTLANIQNMRVTQGPIQRLFDIADLEVQTAGGGGGRDEEQGKSSHKGNLHLGHLRGLEDAAGMRDRLREVVARHRDAGLGDPDDHRHAASVGVPARTATGEHLVSEPSAGEPSGLLAAAQELVAESRALRAELDG